MRTAEQRRGGAASEDAPAALLRSWRGAGFLPDMAEGGSLSFRPGRLGDPLGEFLSCFIMGYNKVKMEDCSARERERERAAGMGGGCIFFPLLFVCVAFSDVQHQSAAR